MGEAKVKPQVYLSISSINTGNRTHWRKAGVCPEPGVCVLGVGTGVFYKVSLASGVTCMFRQPVFS